jgi:hypothetical protein
MMPLYRRKAHAAQTESAIQWTEQNYQECQEFCGAIPLFVFRTVPEWQPQQLKGRLIIMDPDFPMWVLPGEFITRNDDTGELDVWEQEHFGATYEPADAPPTEHGTAAAPEWMLGLSAPPFSQPIYYLFWCEHWGRLPLGEFAEADTSKSLNQSDNAAWQDAYHAGLIYFDTNENPNRWRLTQKGRNTIGNKPAAEQSAEFRKRFTSPPAPPLSEPLAYLAWCDAQCTMPLAREGLGQIDNAIWRAAMLAGEIYFDETSGAGRWRLTDKGYRRFKGEG